MFGVNLRYSLKNSISYYKYLNNGLLKNHLFINHHILFYLLFKNISSCVKMFYLSRFKNCLTPKTLFPYLK